MANVTVVEAGAEPSDCRKELTIKMLHRESRPYGGPTNFEKKSMGQSLGSHAPPPIPQLELAGNLGVQLCSTEHALGSDMHLCNIRDKNKCVDFASPLFVEEVTSHGGNRAERAF